MQRSLLELVDADDPAMPAIAAWTAQAPREVEIAPADAERAAATLVTLQVTTRSTLGAIAFETGGVLIDGGWLRVLGSGSPRLSRGLVDWNALDGERRLPGALLIGDDAIGGFFAVNGGGLDVDDSGTGGEPGSVCYFAPDTCAWEDLELGYSDWLRWAITGDLDTFYDASRWPGWRTEVADLDSDRGYLVYPPAWTAGPPLEARSRKAVPITELWEIHTVEYATLLGAGSPTDDDM